MHIRSITRHSIKPSRHFNFRLSFLIAGVALLLLFKPGFSVASDLAGTWSGTVDENGTQGKMQLTFSPAGHYVVTYTNNTDTNRSAELTTPGQKVHFVPPGGGVQTITVTSLNSNTQGIVVGLTYAFEKAMGSYMDKSFIAQVIECRLTPNGLAVQILTKIGDAEPFATVGVLQKVP